MSDDSQGASKMTQAKYERMEEALNEIASWANAYPLEVFPEPDLKKARTILEAGGVTLDSISAHAMRHVITRVAEIARKGLGK